MVSYYRQCYQLNTNVNFKEDIMKRIIALICVMFIVFGACCGCNRASASSGDAGASSTTNSDSQVSAGNDSTASSDNQSSGEGGYTRPTPNLGGKTIKVLEADSKRIAHCQWYSACSNWKFLQHYV